MGEVSYRPLIEEMTWSYSRLKSFETCPYKWFCNYILGEEEEPEFYASYGSFVHRLIEEYYLGLTAKEDLPLRFLTGFAEEVEGERPQPSTVQKYISQGLEYFENFEPFPYEMVAVEKQLNFTVGDLNCTCFLDFLGKDDDGLVIVDHKSREMKQRSRRKTPTLKDQELDDMLAQLYLYAEAVRQNYGEYPAKLVFNSFRTGELIEEPFNEERLHETLDWVRKTADEIAGTEEFWPDTEYFKCRFLCGFHRDCCYWQYR